MGIVENIKSVASTVQQIDNIELYSKILNVQKEAMDLLQENRELKIENEDVKDKLKIKDSLCHDRESYWIKKDVNESDGPFCTRCWDVDKNLVRMHKKYNGYYACPEKDCGGNVQVYPEQEQRVYTQLPND